MAASQVAAHLPFDHCFDPSNKDVVFTRVFSNITKALRVKKLSKSPKVS